MAEKDTGKKTKLSSSLARSACVDSGHNKGVSGHSYAELVHSYQMPM